MARTKNVKKRNPPVVVKEPADPDETAKRFKLSKRRQKKLDRWIDDIMKS